MLRQTLYYEYSWAGNWGWEFCEVLNFSTIKLKCQNTSAAEAKK